MFVSRLKRGGKKIVDYKLELSLRTKLFRFMSGKMTNEPHLVGERQIHVQMKNMEMKLTILSLIFNYSLDRPDKVRRLYSVVNSSVIKS